MIAYKDPKTVEDYLLQCAGRSVTHIRSDGRDDISVFLSEGETEYGGNKPFISTMGLSNVDIQVVGNRGPVRTELVFSLPDLKPVWIEMLLDIARRIATQPVVARPNHIFKDVLSAGHRHVLLLPPFHDNVRMLNLDEIKVAWLQPVMISDDEVAFERKQQAKLFPIRQNLGVCLKQMVDIANPYRSESGLS